MQKEKRFSFVTLRLAGFLVLALMLLGARASVSAQDATPTMGADMGNCVEALGIGSDGDACVNIIHASPDAPGVDVYVNGELALENLEFGTASGWVALPAGEHQVQVTATGGAPEDAVIDAPVTLEAGAAYEVAAVGLLADIAPVIYQTDLSALGEDEARIKVVHASPDVAGVDIAVTGGDVLIENLEFPAASEALVVPSGSYDLEVRPSGSEDVALPLPGVVLEAGTVYTVYAIGQAGDGTLNVLVVTATTVAPDMATPAA
jgi:hypothetical protein